MANVYNRGKYLCISQDVDGLTLTAILMDAPHSPINVDNNTLSQVSTNRLGTDQVLTTIASTEDDTNDIAYLDADDPTWTSVAGGSTVTGCDIYSEVGAETVDELLCFVDTADTATNGGNITINFSATEGFMKLT